MKKLAARIALVTAVLAAPSLVFATEPKAEKTDKKDEKKKDEKKKAEKKEEKKEAGGGW